jgi:ketosteroid isomerase-like protein
VVDGSNSLGPDVTVIHGRDAAERFWRQFMGSWEFARWEIDDYLDTGDRVAVLGSFRGRGAGSGADVEATFAQLFTSRDGLLAHAKLLQTRADALAAAGLGG